MSETPPTPENQTVDISSPRITDRLQRLFNEIPELAPIWNDVVLVISPDNTTVTATQFVEMCFQVSVRPESLSEWSDEYFDDNFEEIVRIIRERGSYPPKD